MYSIFLSWKSFIVFVIIKKTILDYKEAFSEALGIVMACCRAVFNLVADFCCTLLLHMTRYVWRCIKSANTLYI